MCVFVSVCEPCVRTTKIYTNLNRNFYSTIWRRWLTCIFDANKALFGFNLQIQQKFSLISFKHKNVHTKKNMLETGKLSLFGCAASSFGYYQLTSNVQLLFICVLKTTRRWETLALCYKLISASVYLYILWWEMVMTLFSRYMYIYCVSFVVILKIS